MAIREEAYGGRGGVAAGEIERLVEALYADDVIRRDTAIARLRVIGERAHARLAAVIGSAPPGARAAALRALEGSTAPQVATLALPALESADVDVAEAAVRVLAPWVTVERGARVLDALLGVVMAPGSDPRIVAAAKEALAALPPELVEPILAPPDLTDDRSTADPATLRQWLTGPGRDSTTHDLSALLDRIIVRERRAVREDERRLWMEARGDIHARLAARGSRLGLPDLRESFERTAGPLPSDFVTAVEAVGDAACLDALARAWAASSEARWRATLTGSGAAIMTRLGLTGRHAAVRKLRARHPGFV